MILLKMTVLVHLSFLFRYLSIHSSISFKNSIKILSIPEIRSHHPSRFYLWLFNETSSSFFFVRIHFQLPHLMFSSKFPHITLKFFCRLVYHHSVVFIQYHHFLLPLSLFPTEVSTFVLFITKLNTRKQNTILPHPTSTLNQHVSSLPRNSSSRPTSHIFSIQNRFHSHQVSYISWV